MNCPPKLRRIKNMLKHKNPVYHLLIILILSISSLSTSSQSPSQEDDFILIFDGKSLKDWDGLEGWWWIEDGTITSESTPEKPCKNAHYLFWTKEQPEDFILKLEFRLRNGNSGIQFRSEKRTQLRHLGLPGRYRRYWRMDRCSFPTRPLGCCKKRIQSLD